MKIKKIILSLILIFIIIINSGCQTQEERVKAFKYIRVDGVYFETKDILDYYYISSGRIRILMKGGIEITTTTYISTDKILLQDEEGQYERNKNILV